MSKVILSKELFKQLPGWLGQARIFWWFVLSLFLVSFIGDWIGIFTGNDRLDRIRYSGWMFEIFGLLAVAFGLNNKLDLLDQKGIWERIREWLEACPLLKRDAIVGVLGAQVGAFGFDVRARLSASINENMPLEDKVKFLLDMYDRLDTELGELSGQHRKDVSDIKAEIKLIQTELSTEIQAVASKSAKVQVGDIGWEFAGLAWILFGITFATVPEFVHSWFWWLIEFFEVLN